MSLWAPTAVLMSGCAYTAVGRDSACVCKLIYWDCVREGVCTNTSGVKKKKKISRNNQVLVLSVHWGSRFLNRATPPGKTKPKKASNIQVNEVKMLSLSYVEGEI